MSSVTAADGAVVCDASVLAAVVFAEPGSPQALALTRTRRLLAPRLLWYEMAHVTVRKCALAPDQARLLERAFAKSLVLPVRLLEPSWPDVVEMAREHLLSAYDASYLQLAAALTVPLATLDERLGQVAQALGLRAAPSGG